MLNRAIPVRWAWDPTTRCHVATEQIPLPAEIEAVSTGAFLGQLRDQEICPCCGGGALCLRLGLADAGLGAVFVQSPVFYCAASRRLLLTDQQAGDYRRRQECLRRDEQLLAIPSVVRSGIGQAVERRPIGSALHRALAGGSEGELRFHPLSRSWCVHPRRSGGGSALPDAVCFHDDALPAEITLKLEPGTRCNFRCGFCYGRHLEQGNLSWEAFSTLLDHVPGVRAVELTGEGEPLVNRQIFAMIAECSRRGLWTHVTTNGSLLDEAAAERLLLAGVASVAVSLESIDAERFAQIRQGGDLNKVLAGIETLARARRRLGRDVELSLWITVLRETLPELPAVGALVERLEIDCVEFQVLNRMEAYSRFYDARLRENHLDPAVLMQEAAERADLTPRVRQALSAAMVQGCDCDVFTHTVMVNWQGLVTPCCLLKAPDFPPLGNLLDTPFEEIWNSEHFRTFRFSLQHGIVWTSCDGCPAVAA